MCWKVLLCVSLIFFKKRGWVCFEKQVIFLSPTLKTSSSLSTIFKYKSWKHLTRTLFARFLSNVRKQHHFPCKFSKSKVNNYIQIQLGLHMEAFRVCFLYLLLGHCTLAFTIIKNIKLHLREDISSQSVFENGSWSLCYAFILLLLPLSECKISVTELQNKGKQILELPTECAKCGTSAIGRQNHRM